MRVETAHGDPGPRQPQEAASVRGQDDRQLDLGLRNGSGNGLDGQMRGHQGDAQTAAAIIFPKQHHRRALGSRQAREKLCLPGELRMAAPDNGFLVDGRRDQSRQFTCQTPPGALSKEGESGLGGLRRAAGELGRQRCGQRIEQQEAAAGSASPRRLRTAG